MEVVLLGTGGPIPDAHRAGPSTLVRAGGRAFLIDCGRGVLLRLTAAGAAAGALSGVLLTHLHSDHITDLNDLITTRWVTSFSPAPLPLYGPAGTGTVVEGLLASLAPDISYRIAHHEDLTWEPPVDVTEVADGVVFDDEASGVRVLGAPSDHRPVAPTLAYRIEAGESAVVLAGDTVPCDGLDRLALGADVLVHTVIRDDLIKSIGVPRLLDVCDYHSTIQQAADTAKRAGVGTLVLTHCVPPISPGAEDEWRGLAAEVFDGTIVVAADLDGVSVG